MDEHSEKLLEAMLGNIEIDYDNVPVAMEEVAGLISELYTAAVEEIAGCILAILKKEEIEDFGNAAFWLAERIEEYDHDWQRFTGHSELCLSELINLTGMGSDGILPECYETIVSRLDENTFTDIQRLLFQHMNKYGLADSRKDIIMRLQELLHEFYIGVARSK